MKHIIHFNRRAKDGRVWSVHNSRGCFQLRKLFVDVPTVTEFKPEKKTNPRAFFVAFGELHIYAGGEGWITKA